MGIKFLSVDLCRGIDGKPTFKPRVIITNDMPEGKSKIYENIIRVLYGCIDNFRHKTGIHPNRVIMSADVIKFIGAYNSNLITNYSIPESKETIMGMELELVYDKQGFIAVGYVDISRRVNLEYQEEG